MFVRNVTFKLKLFLNYLPVHQTFSDPNGVNTGVMFQLSDIIRVQNETINLLEDALTAKSKIPNLAQLMLSASQKEEKISELTTELQLLRHKLESNIINVNSAVVQNSVFDESFTSTASTTSFLVPEQEGLHKECSAKYGKMMMILNDRTKEYTDYEECV